MSDRGSTTVHGGKQQQTNRDLWIHDPLYQCVALPIKFLMENFSDPEAPESMAPFKYYDTDKDTGLFITNEAPVKQSTIENRPTIIVVRGPTNDDNLGIGDFDKSDPAIQDIFTEGDFIGAVSLMLNFHCICHKGLEAQRLAWAVRSLLRHNYRVLTRRGFLSIGKKRVTVSSESTPGHLVTMDSETRSVMVTVSTAVQFMDMWRFQFKQEVAPGGLRKPTAESTMNVTVGDTTMNTTKEGVEDD